MIQLRNVGPDNWRCGLRVRDDQRRYVSDSAGILARAYAYRDYNSRAFVVYDDETPVGVGLYYDCDEPAAYDFSQLFIDERFQGRGFGATAAALMLERMRREGRFDRAILCYIEGNEVARRMYEKLGFTHTGERDEDEIIMELIL